MDVIQANIDRSKLLLTREPYDSKTEIVMSQLHDSADENVDHACSKCRALMVLASIEENILVTTGERLSAQRAAPL
jgi:hypothetical protein